ncbi:M1 family metallopeptidase [Limibacter armeniacum]|uniref:M1 family metallopeptidase n=1 Tax=Limibacter armeniacum TaxID=466084 RepID=UPI002FE59624
MNIPFRQLSASLIIIIGFLGCKTSQPGTPPEPNIVIEETDDSTSIVEELMKQPASRPAWAQEKGVYHPEQTKFFDLKNTKLDIRFDWENQYVIGKATLTMAPYFYPQEKIILDAKGFDINAVELKSSNGNQSLKYNYDGLLLTISLDKTYNRNETIDIIIDYIAKPNELQSMGSDAITSDKGLYFINPLGKETGKPQQIWTQGETEASSCWFPTFDAPNVKTKQEIYITVEDRFKTISNGKLISQQQNKDGSRTDYWKQELPHAPYLFAMAVGEFAIVEDTWNGKKVGYVVESEFEQYAKDIFGNTPEMMTFYSKVFNYDFAWDKYYQIVVRDFVSGAMENTSASIFMESLQVDDRTLLDQSWDFIIAHELIHHWFGDLVTCESWANLPLNESFANYGEYLWIEHKYGPDEAEMHKEQELMQYLYEATSKQVPLIRYHYKDREDMFDSHSYAKGGVIMHMLRKTVGDDAFFAAIHDYLEKKEFDDAEIHDLRLSFEAVTGQDLNWFFNQWFMSSGHPTITVSQSYDHGKVTLQIAQTQNQEYTPVYRIPLTVDIWEGGNKRRETITLTKAEESFSFPVSQSPELVLFDAERIIPGIVHHEKTTEELAFQAKYAENIIHRLHALNNLTDLISTNEEVGEIFYRSLKDNSWAIRELAAESFEKYTGSLMSKVRPTIKDMIIKDPKSMVRVAALNTYTSIEPNSLLRVQEALSDSSYSVLATALYKYIELGGNNPTELYSKYEDVDNLNIIIVLADYYAYHKIPEKVEWFGNKLNKISDHEKAYLFNYLGTYAMQQPEDVQMRAAEILIKYAENSINYHTRIGAYQGLSLLNEKPEIDALVKKIANKEVHPEVISNLRSLGVL